MASCCSHVDIRVAMAVPTKRPGEVVNSRGRSIVMWGALSPYKDLAIFAKLGGGVCFCFTGLPGGVDICHVKIFGIPVCLLEVVGVEAVIVEGMMRGLEHPRKGMVRKEPQGWALWLLLWLCALVASCASSPTTLEHWEGVTITQGGGGSLVRTSSSLNVVNSSMHCLSSSTHSASLHSLPRHGGLATLAQCCRAFAYTKLFSDCFKWKSCVPNLGFNDGIWLSHSCNTGRQCCVVIVPLGGAIAFFGHVERCLYPPHKCSDVSSLGDCY